MAVGFSNTNKPINPRGADASPKGYNRAALYSGKALDFDGVNDSINCGDFDGASFGNGTTDTPCSIVSYFYLDDADRARVLGKHTEWVFGTNNLNEFNFSILDGTGTANQIRRAGISALPYVGKWVHMVATYDGSSSSSGINVYINGVLSNGLAEDVGSYVATQNTAADVYVGLWSVDSRYLNGKVSGTKIFNTALTAAQVSDLYNNPEKVVPTGVDNTALKLWLPMQEGAGTTAYDGSGNGNHGTISGATWTHGIGAPVSQTAVIDWNKGVNSFTYSEDFSNADWITIDVTKVSTSETDYIGGTTAANITWLAGSPRYFYQNIGVSGASTLSFYVKSNGGGNKFRLFGNGTLAMGSDMTATSEWVRYDFEFTGNASQGIGITQASDNSAADLLVCFAQVETNASIGPYIPTLATAQTSPVLLPQGLTTGRDITGVNLFENVRKQGALNLDGNSWAEVHDNASLDIGSTDDLTMELWINRLDTPAQTYSKWFDAGPNLTLNDTNYSMGSITTIDEVFVEWRTSSSGWIYTDTDVTFNKNEWTHLVVTIEMTGVNSSIKTYKNGVLSSTKSQTTERGTGGRTTIGRTRWNAARTMPDQIAQPRIYNRALTAEEVARNYNSGKAIYTNS